LSSGAQRLSHWGRLLRDDASLAENHLGIGSSLDVQGRLRGGGGDGGSTGSESRSSYLEMYAIKKPEKVQGSHNTEDIRWTARATQGDKRLSGYCVIR
jgi:hypothetical protein